MEPFTAMPVVIGSYCDKSPALRASMQEQIPTTTRFLDALEEFHFLLNYRLDSMSPMAVVLVGQTELWENKPKLQRYAAVRQRIDMCCTLPHSDRSETEQYIASHMDYS